MLAALRVCRFDRRAALPQSRLKRSSRWMSSLDVPVLHAL